MQSFRWQKVGLHEGHIYDTAYFRFEGGSPAESKEISKGIIVDYDSAGDVCGIEVISFSQRSMNLNSLLRLSSEEILSRIVSS